LKRLYLNVTKANRIKRMLDSEVWKIDIQPMLDDEHDKILYAAADVATTRGVDGELPSMERIALNASHCGGRRANLEWFARKLREIITKGDESEIDLKNMEARK
jgi:hypothetical protein